MDTTKLTSDDLHIDFNNPIEFKKYEEAKEIVFDKAKNALNLTEVEKELLCRGLKYANPANIPFDLKSICENHNFKFHYLVYMWDLTGGSKYVKPFKTEKVKVPIPEAQADLQNLMLQADAWQNILGQSNLQDELLIQSKREADFSMNGVKADPSYISGGGNRRAYMTRTSYLHSKFIYLLAKEVFESFDSQEFILEMDGKQIIINEFSIIHIVSRHYAEIMKQYKSGKSFHNENFNPKLLNKELKYIFDKIDQAGGLNQVTVREINFVFKGTTYRIYTTDSKKNNDPIFVSTFFPVSDQKILDSLANTHDLITIDNDISYYKAK